MAVKCHFTMCIVGMETTVVNEFVLSAVLEA